MSYGLRVWNASGVLTLDVSERLSQVIQYGQLTCPPGVTVVTYVTGMVTGGSYMVFCAPVSFGEPASWKWGMLRPVIYNGYFTVRNDGSAGYPTETIKYTVFRR